MPKRLWKSLPAWGVWIEIELMAGYTPEPKSLPAWGVWIEMCYHVNTYENSLVAPRMGSVD